MATQSTVDQRIVSINEALDNQIRRSNRTRNTTLIVGVILLAIICGYFAWAGYQVRQIMNPKDLAGVAAYQLVSFIKEYRPTAEREARANAGPLVNRLVDEVLENQLPSGRRYLETYAKEKSDEALDKMTAYLLDELQTGLEANRQSIIEMSENLETGEGREAFKESLVAVIRESVDDPEITTQLDEYAYALRDLEGTLTRITTGGENLTPSDKATHDLIAVVLEVANRKLTNVDLRELPSFEGVEALVEE
jgi:hypothetical protein